MKNIQFLRLSHFIDNTSSAFAWLPRLATTVVDTFSVHTQSDHLTIQNIYFFQHMCWISKWAGLSRAGRGHLAWPALGHITMPCIACLLQNQLICILIYLDF